VPQVQNVPSSRRRARWLAAVVVLALGASACGGDDGDDSSAAADTSGTSREVAHEFGTTVIEGEPERVVTVDVTGQDYVLAVGVIPVGVTDWYGDQPFATWPWAQDELGDAEPEVLTTTDGFDYEQIAALDPDLIIGTNAGMDDESYELLSAIAPTIAHPAGAEPWFSAWDEQAELIGQALGKEAEMTAIVDEIKGQFAEAAEAHPEFDGQKVVFLQNAFYDGEAIAYQDGLSTDFLTDLGFVVPSEIDPFVTEGEQAYIPLEQLSVLDAADVLVWGTEGPDDRTALESEPLYMALEEVEEGRLVFTDGVTAGAIYFTSPLSLPFVLDQLVPALASIVAGDGPVEIDAAG
jgi:iron complex transport system substrate-binding protein